MSEDFKIVFIVGMTGVGKSHLGKYAANKLKVQFFDLDIEIEKKYKMSIAKLFETKKESEFREIEFETLKEITKSCTEDTIISTGGGTPCFNNAMDWMNENGITVWLNAGFAYIINNLSTEKEERPLFKGLKSIALLEKITKIYGLRRPFYAKSSRVVSVYKGLRADLFTKSLHLSTFAMED